MTVLQLLLGIVQCVLSVDEKAFVVLLDVNGSSSNCAGSIITENAVLTTAQCVHGNNPSDVTVVQYTPNAVHRHPAHIVFVHPDFCPITLYRDVSVVKTRTKFRDPWKPIVLNDVGLHNSLRIYQNCNMIGWLLSDGMTFLNVEKHGNFLDSTRDDFIFDGDAIRLTRVFVNLITRDECTRKIKNFGGSFDGVEKLCGVSAQKTDWCSIGSGGPLLCLDKGRVPSTIVPYSPDIGSKYNHHVSDRLEDPFDLLADFRATALEERRRRGDPDDEYQIGIVSWGKICSKVPSIFVRVDSNYEWITNTVALFDNRTRPLRTFTDIFRTVGASGRPFLEISSFLLILTFVVRGCS